MASACIFLLVQFKAKALAMLWFLQLGKCCSTIINKSIVVL
jgi:hypothetical protein